MFHGNTTVTVHRGSTQDPHGDPVDVNTVLYANVRASVIEQARRVFVPADNQDRVVRFIRGRLPSNLTILEGDRLLDERNGLVYIVEAVTQPGSAFAANENRLELKRVS